MGKNRFHFAINSNTIKERYSHVEIASLAKKVGCDGIEWGLPPLNEASKVAPELVRVTKDQGLEVVSFINAGHLWKQDVIKRWSEIAAQAEVKILRVAPPWSAGDFKESLHQKSTFNDLIKMAREGMEKLVPLSYEYGIRYVIEIHHGGVAASPCLAKNLCKDLDPKAVGIIYDPANGVEEGFLRPRNALELMEPYLAYVHAKNVIYEQNTSSLSVKKWNYKVCQLSKGLIDWEEVVFALNTIGYSGWFSFEGFFLDNSEKELRIALKYLKECIIKAPKAIQEPFTSFND